MKKLITTLWLLCLAAPVIAQTAPYDSLYGRRMLDTLASPYMLGRGYYREGDEKAADLIATEFYKNGIQPFQKLNYYQQFNFSVNTFPHTVDVSFDKTALTPGADYIVSPGCPSAKGTYKVVVCDSKTINNPNKRNKFLAKKYPGKYVIFNLKGVDDETTKKIIGKVISANTIGAAGIVEVKDKLTWSVQQTVDDFVGLTIDAKAIKKYPKKITVDIENKYLRDYTGRNVMGFVKGTEVPDSFLVFSAHYDHLGIMGHKAMFNGANDNASGCAMMLSLAKYYAKNPPKYSVAFIGFGGEELGLLGSFNYVEHPVFPLEKIKFMINLDIMGTGDEGITVVNGTTHKAQFDSLTAINTKLNLLKLIKIRNNAPNSDHYPFVEKGVPAVFIYTMGNVKFYHDIYDTRESLPMNEFKDIYILLTEFVKTF